MSKYGIIVNADDCVGCHACFVACKEENQVAPGVKWNHLERLEHPAEEVIEYFRVLYALRKSRLHEGLPGKSRLLRTAR